MRKCLLRLCFLYTVHVDCDFVTLNTVRKLYVNNQNYVKGKKKRKKNNKENEIDYNQRPSLLIE